MKKRILAVICLVVMLMATCSCLTNCPWFGPAQVAKGDAVDLRLDEAASTAVFLQASIAEAPVGYTMAVGK